MIVLLLRQMGFFLSYQHSLSHVFFSPIWPTFPPSQKNLLVGRLHCSLPFRKGGLANPYWSAAASPTATQSLPALSCSLASSCSLATPHKGRWMGIPSTSSCFEPLDNLRGLGGMLAIES